MASFMGSLVAMAIAAAGTATLTAQRSLPPANDGLLETTQRAAAQSELGDLRAAQAEGTDVELRLWAGFGTEGTHGLILRRRGGAWTSTVATVEDCTIVVPAPRERRMTDTERAAYERQALEHCDTGPRSMDGSGHVVTAHRLLLAPAQLGGDLDSLWQELLSNGLAELPPSVQRDSIMFDGHTYVVELRTPEGYRASVIECTTPEVPADAQVQRIAALLFERLPTAFWLQCIPPRAQ
ncbi:MAG: hypothetical protein AB7U83_17435 [Vicinamibacterales bacterium]